MFSLLRHKLRLRLAHKQSFTTEADEALVWGMEGFYLNK